MTTNYCDCCGTLNEVLMSSPIEMRTSMVGRNKKSARLTANVVIDSTDDNFNEFCKYCILDALYELDDRRKYTNA